MLKKFNLFALLMTLCAGSLVADFDPSQGQWKFQAEWLYMLPSFDDTYFVIDSDTSTTFPNGTRKNNDFKFHNGYRIGGSYTLCECAAQIDLFYAHLSNKQNRTVTGDFLWATLGRPDFASSFENYTGSAHSHLKNTYNRIDAFYSQQVFDCCGLGIGVQFGLEVADLKLNENYTYASRTTLGTISSHSHACGLGPQLGFVFNYELFPQMLGLRVSTTGSFLAAHCKSSASNVLNGVTTLDVNDNKTWRVIPAFHTRIGLNYALEISCYKADIEFGYEFNSYLRGRSAIHFVDDVADGLCETYYTNYDVKGIYLAASMRF